MTEKGEIKIKEEVEVNIEIGGDREERQREKERDREQFLSQQNLDSHFSEENHNKMHIVCRIRGPRFWKLKEYLWDYHE